MSVPKYRVEGDLPIKNVTDWLHGSKLVHADETLCLNWRIVNNEGRTLVAFAGGAGLAIADFVCNALNNNEIFK